MAERKENNKFSKEKIEGAFDEESSQFEAYFDWLEQHMPNSFFEETTLRQMMLITHNLMGFNLQNYYSQIFMENSALVLCLDSTDVDLRILKHYNLYGIRNYQTYISDEPPPFPGVTKKLRIAIIYFSEPIKKDEPIENILKEQDLSEIFTQVTEKIPELTFEEFQDLIYDMNPRFLRSLNAQRLISAISMFFRAKTRDYCQYEVRYIEDWDKGDRPIPSMRIVLAWRNTPKHRFLYRLAKTVYRHGLTIERVNATYVDPYSTQSILIMSLAIHGIEGKAAWEEADIPDFLQELVTLKYFDSIDTVESIFIDSGLLSGNLGNLVRSMISFVHQVLTHVDPYLYSISNVEEAYCRHPELTVKLCRLFERKFHPDKNEKSAYHEERASILELVNNLDTGNEVNDNRRKNILIQTANFIEYTLKTNFYRNNKSAHSFRLDPKYLDHAPFERSEKFPELPFGIFFIKGMHFIGFHIRFKDLSRGGLRTVMPQRFEQMTFERNNVFLECYNLAFTQQKKNKDIPEGGSKAIIFLEPYERLHSESDIYSNELTIKGYSEEQIKEEILSFRKGQKIEYLYQTQRAFIHSLLSIVNCHDDGCLKAKHIIDYWKKPEYLYLGPDENMHNHLIDWISQYSKHCGYKPGIAFISSKPGLGINHKEYGVTSFGVNVYMIEMLKFIGIDPYKDPFTVKISGGPDGDVAGNQILNLYKYFPKTAKLLAITDISGTIFDPEGLDLKSLVKLFEEEKPLREYPHKKLHVGGFLLDLQSKQESSAYSQQTLLWKNEKGKVTKNWISGNEMNHLFKNNLNMVEADIFIPAGGRPRTININNYKEYLDETGKPTSKAIVEGANLYLTPEARLKLEDKGIFIIKDSSANKGGVMCSSLEVLAGLLLTGEEFLAEKNDIMKAILDFIQKKAEQEASLILRTYGEIGGYLTDISDLVSKKINTYMYEILEHLDNIDLPSDPQEPLIRCLLSYPPEIFREKYADRIIYDLPDSHKKAMIACYIASKVVYKRGLSWSPSIVDVLPLIAEDPDIKSAVNFKKRDIKLI